MLNVTKSIKLAVCVALLALATACAPVSYRQTGIYGPPIPGATVAAGDCNTAAGVQCPTAAAAAQ
jgi:hypothetical protein